MCIYIIYILHIYIYILYYIYTIIYPGSLNKFYILYFVITIRHPTGGLGGIGFVEHLRRLTKIRWWKALEAENPTVRHRNASLFHSKTIRNIRKKSSKKSNRNETAQNRLLQDGKPLLLQLLHLWHQTTNRILQQSIRILRLLENIHRQR